MNKFIDKLGNSKIFMSIVMVYNIIFNILLMVIYFVGSPTNGSVSYSAFGFEMNIASHIVLAIVHLLFLVFGIYIFIKLLKRYKDKINMNLQNVVLSGKNNNLLNLVIVSIFFLWNIIYNLLFFYLAISPAISSIIHKLDVLISTILISILIAIIGLIIAILNTIYYTFLIKKLLQKPKEDANNEVKE